MPGYRPHAWSLVACLGRTVMMRACDVEATEQTVDPTEIYDGSSIAVTQDGRVVDRDRDGFDTDPGFHGRGV